MRGQVEAKEPGGDGVGVEWAGREQDQSDRLQDGRHDDERLTPLCQFSAQTDSGCAISRPERTQPMLTTSHNGEGW
jgi:hypothetical protein